MRVRQGNNGRHGFSLIELVIVVVIIGIIGAIAIPRMSRGAAGASDNALRANLAVLRNALDLYAAEHNGKFPTADAINAPSKTADPSNDGNALLDYTTAAGTGFSATKNTATGAIYGPYLRAIPPLPVGEHVGMTKFGGAGAADVGWIYDGEVGTVKANASGADDAGKAYASY